MNTKKLTKHMPGWATELVIGGFWAASAVNVAGYVWNSFTSTWSALPDAPTGGTQLQQATDQFIKNQPGSGNAFNRFVRGAANFFQTITGLPIAHGDTTTSKITYPKSFRDMMAYTKAGNVQGMNRSYDETVRYYQSQPLGAFNGQEQFVVGYLFQNAYGKPLWDKFVRLTRYKTLTPIIPPSGPVHAPR